MDFRPDMSPIQRIEDPLLDQKSVMLWVKRDDLLTAGTPWSAVSGNKFRKLKKGILEVDFPKNTRILTFGGAFSNHIAATAAAGQLKGMHTIGVIRGDAAAESPTLKFARACGMTLDFVDRTAYRDKAALVEQLRYKWGDFVLLPEGGTDANALWGCREIVTEVHNQLETPPDYWAVACGTGGTVAGIIQESQCPVIGFSALKGDFLRQDVTKLLDTEGGGRHFDEKDWHITDAYCFGGYAKWQPELIAFINDFKQKHGIPLDPIYTGKLFFGLFDLISKDFFPKNSRIVAVHTGGLQGIEGFNTRFGPLIQ